MERNGIRMNLFTRLMFKLILPWNFSILIRKAGNLFFLHLAYHAPHYPLHAKPEDIAKYRGKIPSWGPNHFRKTRFAKLKELGLINPEWKLSPSSDDNNEWEKLSAEDKNKYDHLMAVYAAMIDNVDQNIGRVMTKLKEMGCFENTLITFSSDNGACPEGSPFNIWSSHTNQRFWGYHMMRQPRLDLQSLIGNLGKPGPTCRPLHFACSRITAMRVGFLPH